MPTTLVFRFPWGRYHATPWHRQVNEGAVEIPPSPWRLLRTLYAVWRTRVPDLPEETVHGLLSELAQPPRFAIPRHTLAHTRHYYPDADDRSGRRSTDKTFDAFAVFGRADELAVTWQVELGDEHRTALEKLAISIPYLGRADSLCEARVETAWEPTSRHELWIPADVAEDIPKNAPATVLLSPVIPLQVEALLASPHEVRSQGLPLPIGAHLIGYLQKRPAERYTPARRPRPRQRVVTAVRFDVLGPAQPPATEAVTYTGLLRQAALSILGRSPADRPATVLGGKDENGKPLAGHDHAHYLPLIHDRRLTGLLVWAPWSADGLPEDELDALLKVRKLWSEDESDRLDVRPSGTGLAKALAPGLTGPALSWISATPYTPSRYAKPSHDWLDFLRDDIAHELAYRGLPPAEVSLVSGEWAAFRRYRPSAQFRHDRRQGSATKPSALLRLQFKTSVTGPIALGHLSHFGLGLFTPE